MQAKKDTVTLFAPNDDAFAAIQDVVAALTPDEVFKVR